MKNIKETRKEHKMKLEEFPFKLIDIGEVQIEYRLNDEKRQLLGIGDIITFTKLLDEYKTTSVVITDLKKYKSLLEMYTASFDQYLYKYYNNPQEVVDDTTYYKEDEIGKYGCLAIHIKKINRS